MGNRFTVLEWRDGHRGWDDYEVWAGESLLWAIVELIRAKRNVGCAFLIWRG